MGGIFRRFWIVRLTTSRPALTCTAVGQVCVFKESTIPRVGFKARLAMPVLKFLEVISRMAVPVVSEPVPAVVGTEWRDHVKHMKGHHCNHVEYLQSKA